MAVVLDRLAAHPGLATRRRDDLMSSIRTTSRIVGRGAAEIPADPALLRELLRKATPAQAGLSRGRFHNVRSLLAAALREAGIKTAPGRSDIPLSPGWNALSKALPDHHFRHGLIRFMRHCSAAGVAPDAVDQATFDSFEEALGSSMVRAPRRVFGTACRLWNRAVDALPGWPQQRVTVPDRRRIYALPSSAFPTTFIADLEAYLGDLANPDPLGEEDRKAASPVTVRQRRQMILALASAAVESGIDAGNLTDLGCLVRPGVAKAAIRVHLDRANGRKTPWLSRLAEMIKNLARHWVKAPLADIEALSRICRRLAVERVGMTPKNRARLRPFEDPVHVDALMGLPARLIARVKKHDRGRRIDAVHMVDALAIELLTVAPMRIRNLAGLELGRHFPESRPGGSVVHLVLAADETKNGQPCEVPLPASTAAMLQLYADHYRPRLGVVTSPWLFPGRGGRRRSTEAFGRQIKDCIRRETGLEMNPHLFRHLAALLFLRAHPGEYETVRRLLGHASITTTTTFYCGMETGPAFARFDGVIDRLRAEAGERPRRARKRHGRT
jgi:integrase